ncbi:hypothetical protein WJX72_011616 [[Myrmecia] bisecta]|uniref:Steroid 5-alpha-reductase DET2 n=1 Tax=[Myrmecia] bisecta TaxID=41462 RepID=A0AAW1Q8Y2_9CHLO
MLGVTAPYGRYSRTGWGCMLPGKLAWVTQEVWSFAVPLYMALTARPHLLSKGLLQPRVVLLALLLLHYFHRSLVYPVLMRGSKGTPLSVWLLATTFTLYNGFLQGWYLTRWQPGHPETLSPRFLLGVALWLGGWAINLQADATLRSLRKPGETGYKIPRGGAFEYVSGANFFGEIVEWAGFALASWSFAAAAFAMFTFCNIAPRAHQHHQWYLKRFKDYPRSRRAVIPYVW